jgi:hypothetical protein
MCRYKTPICGLYVYDVIGVFGVANAAADMLELSSADSVIAVRRAGAYSTMLKAKYKLRSNQDSARTCILISCSTEAPRIIFGYGTRTGR